MDRLKLLLQNTNETIKRSDDDCVIPVIGFKGSGKSNFTLWAADYWEGLNTRPFDLGNIIFDAKTFLSRIQNCAQYSCLIGDEGIEVFFSRLAMTWRNKKLAKAIAQARAGKNLLIFINMTDLRFLENYIRTGEATAIIRCVKKWHFEDGRLLKGFAEVYNAKAMLKIKNDREKGVIWPRPSFIDTFPDLKKEKPELWQRYLEMSVPHKKANREKDLTDWDKKPKTEQELRRQIEIKDFVLKARKGRWKTPYRTIQKQLKRKFGETRSTYTLIAYSKQK